MLDVCFTDGTQDKNNCWGVGMTQMKTHQYNVGPVIALKGRAILMNILVIG